jgi:dienelactone hydrolase
MKYVVLFSFAILALTLLSMTPLEAKLVTQTVEYKHGDVTCEGYLAYDDAVKGPRPGVLIVHQWMGLGKYEQMRAEQLAQLGYVALAADIYGKGVRPKSREEASAAAGQFYKDRTLLRARAAAGLKALVDNKMVDPKRVAVMGYCFGGGTALELARSGADIVGAVSFHGTLDTPNPADAKNIKAKILVLHGAADPFVGPDKVTAFQKEMTDANVDWQFVAYSNAVHAFTMVDAGSDSASGAAYNEKADKRSWQAMRDFFNEIFK